MPRASTFTYMPAAPPPHGPTTSSRLTRPHATPRGTLLRRRNPRYLPRSKFIVSLSKFMVSIINALPANPSYPTQLRWSLVFVCLCFLLIQQASLAHMKQI